MSSAARPDSKSPALVNDEGSRSTVLLAGFESSAGRSIGEYLSQHTEVLSASDREGACRLLQGQPVDLVLCRHSREHIDAIPFLRKVRTEYPDTIRILGGNLSHAEMVAAINEAAIFQFFPEEWPPEQIELLVRRALESRELAYRHRHLSRELKFAEDVLQRLEHSMQDELRQRYRFDRLIYRSGAMVALADSARKAAGTELPVLIQGETGTGKELLARAIHYNSDRREQPLMVQNCGGIPDELLHSELFGHKRGAFTGAVSDRLGLFPAADGGTVFLDDISEVSPAFQVSLLRFLQGGEVKPVGSDTTVTCDVRIIAASNRRLDELIEAGDYRRDLYYRLNGFQLDIPPLRDRLDDIPVLAEFLAQRYGESIGRRIVGIAPGLAEKLEAYDWPGNVRELENEMKRMVALAGNGELLTVERLSSHIAELAPRVRGCASCKLLNGETLKEKVEALEAALVAESLRRHRWNQLRAAADLGISRVGIANKIKRYGLRGQQQRS